MVPNDNCPYSPSMGLLNATSSGRARVQVTEGGRCSQSCSSLRVFDYVTIRSPGTGVHINGLLIGMDSALSPQGVNHPHTQKQT